MTGDAPIIAVMNSDLDLLSLVIAGRTVGEGIAEATAAGKLVQQADGKWSVPRPDASPSDWMRESRDASRKCPFYAIFMFRHIYRTQHVPAGCASCYKVKVAPKTLRELVALRQVAQALPYSYKCGLDAPSAVTSGLYGGYFYLNGLDAARAAFPSIRDAVTSHPKLGADVPVFIKRGCTEYEVGCGPSDKWRFPSELMTIETALLARVQVAKRPPPSSLQIKQTFAHWITTAYRLGDDTYLDFTGGRRLYPAVVRYDPEGGAD